MKLFTDFIENGTRPKSQRDTSAILDFARSQILLLTNKLPQTMKLFPATVQAQADELARLKAENEALRNQPATIGGMSMEKAIAIAATAPKGQVLKTLTAAHMAEERKPSLGEALRSKSKPPVPTATAKPAAPIASAPPAPKLTTAAEFTGSPLVMARSEWQSLSHSNRAKFFSDGGKLVD